MSIIRERELPTNMGGDVRLAWITARSWSDADGLVTALGDPECAEARKRYLASTTERRTS